MCKPKSGCYKNEDYVKHEYKCEFCNKTFNTYKHAFTYHGELVQRENNRFAFYRHQFNSDILHFVLVD